MKRLFLIGILTGALAGVAAAQTAPQATPTPEKKAPATTKKATTQKATTAETAGEVRLGAVRLPKKVLANGQPLAAGTYQLRATDEEAKPAAGETPSAERWVIFMQNGKEKGREIASVIPDSEIAQVAEGPGKPAKGHTRVDLLKTNKYWRVWVNKGGNNYLIHLPPAS